MTIQNEQCTEKEQNHLNGQIEKGGSSGISLQKFTLKIEQECADFLGSYVSENTRGTYERALNAFLSFFREQGIVIESLKDVLKIHVDMFKQHLLKRYAHCPASAYVKLASVLSLLKFAHEQGWTPINVGTSVRLPRVQRNKGKTEALSEEDLQSILFHLKLAFSLAKNLRDPSQRKDWLYYVVFVTFCELGMRATELVNLKIKDLNLSGKLPRLHLKLKGGELHSPLISDDLSLLLQKYIANLRIGANANDPLFTLQPYSKKPLTRQYLAQMISHIAKAHGIEKKITPHSLRATTASLLHKRNVPIGEIQDLLGHKSILTTMMYVRMSEEETQSAGRKLNLINNK